MSRSSSSFPDSSGKGGVGDSVPFEQLQASSSQGVQHPFVLNPANGGKSNWLIRKEILHPHNVIVKSLEEIPSIESLNSFLASNEFGKKEGSGTWLAFRFSRDRDTDNKVCYSGVFLNLPLHPLTTPKKAQMVWEAMLKKLLEPDDDLACWVDYIKEFAIDNKPNYGGFEMCIKTNLIKSEYDSLAEKVKDFFRIPFKEHGVTLTNDGSSDDFMTKLKT